MKPFLLISFVIVTVLSYGQNHGESISFRAYKKKSLTTPTHFAVKGSASFLKNNPTITYKYTAGGWHYIYCTPEKATELLQEKKIDQLYFSPSAPSFMNDTMRIVQNIDSIHNGSAPLISPFTGKDIIVGYIDSGIDFNHEDFKNEDGSTRVLFYWDHTLGVDVDRTPTKYGYGQVWTHEDIDGGVCTSGDASAHGTTVSGAGSGNGRATGTHKGVAPESDIIVVETNFGLANWTLTIADAVDYIFSMADSLGKPAVVNASLGSYLGSHDGTDPASVVIDSLLDAKAGRIMVSAAGNSGNRGKYHVKGIVDSDTSFTWFDVNEASAFDVPAVYMDLWADTASFNSVSFAFGADKVEPTVEFRARTAFYSIAPLIGTTTYDTIRVGENNLAPVEFFVEEINGVYHLEMVMLNPDSADYLFRFETTGTGVYDAWSGAWIGASDIISEGLPSVADFSAIAHYHLPDTLSTLVSSWACSPKVVTVGNFKNQYDYIDYTGNPYILSDWPTGKLSINSSKGPNRLGYIKPDVAATGDGIMSACPLWLSSSLVTSNPSMLAEGGQHVRNGGTSMASPVIAGIAALYLEKCPTSSYSDFLDALHTNAYADLFTETTPNYAYGYGKVNAFQLLNTTNFDVTLVGDTLICEDPVVFSTLEGDFESYTWFNEETTPSIEVDETSTVAVTVTNDKGCSAVSDSILVIKGTLPTYPVVNIVGGGLITTPADSFIWYYNGIPIDSSNAQYYNPDSTGDYSVQVFSPEGCTYTSEEIYINLSTIEELTKNEFVIFPNPFVDHFNIIKSELTIINAVVTDMQGKLVYSLDEIDKNNLFTTIDLTEMESGVYLLSIYYDNNFKSFRLVKQ